MNTGSGRCTCMAQGTQPSPEDEIGSPDCLALATEHWKLQESQKGVKGTLCVHLN